MLSSGAPGESVLRRGFEEGALPERAALSFEADDLDVQNAIDAHAFAQKLVAPDPMTDVVVDKEYLRGSYCGEDHIVKDDGPFPVVVHRMKTDRHRTLVGATLAGVLGPMLYGLTAAAPTLFGVIAFGAAFACAGAGLGYGSVRLLPRLRRRAPELPPISTKRFRIAFTPERISVVADDVEIRAWPLSEVRGFRAERLRVHLDHADGKVHMLPIGLESHEAVGQIAMRASELLADARQHAPRGYR